MASSNATLGETIDNVILNIHSEFISLNKTLFLKIRLRLRLSKIKKPKTLIL